MLFRKRNYIAIFYFSPQFLLLSLLLSPLSLITNHKLVRQRHLLSQVCSLFSQRLWVQRRKGKQQPLNLTGREHLLYKPGTGGQRKKGEWSPLSKKHGFRSLVDGKTGRRQTNAKSLLVTDQYLFKFLFSYVRQRRLGTQIPDNPLVSVQRRLSKG